MVNFSVCMTVTACIWFRIDLYHRTKVLYFNSYQKLLRNGLRPKAVTKKGKGDGPKTDILSMVVSSVVLEGASMADRGNHYNWTRLSISLLCTRLNEVTWLSVLASDPVLHILPPGRCTSLLWLNRLSRDPINHHLHSRPVRSPFTTTTSSDMYTLLFTHALHAILNPQSLLSSTT